MRAAIDPDPGPEPFSFFFVAEPGFGRSHDGAAFGRSFAVWFDSSRGFDDGLKIAVAHELVHRVLGTKLYLVDETGAEAQWFSEGFTVHYARKLLLASKRISPEAFLDDVRRSEGDSERPDAWGQRAVARSRVSRQVIGCCSTKVISSAARSAWSGSGRPMASPAMMSLASEAARNWRARLSAGIR